MRGLILFPKFGLEFVTIVPVKFSTDTERLQHINSIRKAPVGAQMKRVIDLLYEVPNWYRSYTSCNLYVACALWS